MPQDCVLQINNVIQIYKNTKTVTTKSNILFIYQKKL